MVERALNVAQKRVAVAGLGIAGFAAADALLELGAQVSIFDASDAEKQKERGQVLEILGAKVYLGFRGELPRDLDLLVVSPGLSPNHPWILDFLKRELPVWGELELAWRLRPLENPAPWLCITGTNGKTTATMMLDSMLKASGLKSEAVGNIGESIVSAVMNPNPAQVLAVEVGAPQLPFVYSMSPESSVVLNLAQDHVDFFGSFQNYHDAKARIYHQTKNACVYNVDDPVTEKMVEKADVVEGARAIGFTLGVPSISMLGVIDDCLVDRAFIENRKDSAQELATFADIKPFAPHNVANALAAAALARSLQVSPVFIKKGLQDFQPAPHRISLVAEINKIKYIDDSKATNTHAADTSLSAYQSVVWIAGGLAKGQDFSDLVKKHLSRIRAVILLGKDRELIKAAFARYSPATPLYEISEINENAMNLVVKQAQSVASSGDVVLLAPGCASWDMFKDYKARGNAFASAVKELN
ncbi:MAG: UDP-N-acetylmuramoyl-L-alanine--D-glutamate ligase [Candidatus Nanopelagicales bacterium]